MNLQEILNYRNNCLHCGRPLVMHVDGYPKLIIGQDSDKLFIKSNKPNGVFLNYHFDGSFERNKRTYKIHTGTVFINKYCHFHMPNREEFKGKTINDIKEISDAQQFSLSINSDNTYNVALEYDGVSCHDDVELWALDTFHSDNITHIYHGFYSKTIGEMLHLKLPIVNLSSIKTKEQFLNKMKLYALLS